MGDIAEAFEQHLRSLSDTDWNALVERVRTPANPSGDQQEPPPQSADSGGAPERLPGAGGKEAAAQRFGAPTPARPGPDTPRSGQGAAGRAEAERRFKKENR
ncbi:hypothetical protein [Mycobacterium camsae]|uniref:hypothetical protein n=1 Tax=Mycobacterium gordonae TaxID=1778 RepID=UPI00197FC7E0|nr:hypothetical protein [Mycobacterium gordonae]